MADSLHNALSNFRSTLLTAVAKLEFELRDATAHRLLSRDDDSEGSFVCCRGTQVHPEDTTEVLTQRIDLLETTLKQVLANLGSRVPCQSEPIVEVEQRVEDLLSVQPPQNTKNIVVNSVKNTPALSTAVAAAMPPRMNLGDEMEVDEEEEQEEEMEVEEEEVEEEEEEEMEVKEEEVEEEEVEEEEVEEEEVEVEEEEVEEEEEEGIEVEEFEYKGRTYQRDAENTVYIDGEPVGTWNGKRILPLPA